MTGLPSQSFILWCNGERYNLLEVQTFHGELWSPLYYPKGKCTFSPNSEAPFWLLDNRTQNDAEQS